MEIKAESKSHLFYLSISCKMSVWIRGLKVQRFSISIRQNISFTFVRTELALTVLEEERPCALIGSLPLQPLEVQLSLSLLLSARPRSLLVLLQRNSQSVSNVSTFNHSTFIHLSHQHSLTILFSRNCSFSVLLWLFFVLCSCFWTTCRQTAGLKPASTAEQRLRSVPSELLSPPSLCV